MARKILDTDEEFEFIFGNTYVKEVNLGIESYAFHIPQFTIYFTPCDDCQDRLHRLIEGTKTFELGRYDIRFKKSLEISDELGWRTVEIRDATEEEKQDEEIPRFEWDHLDEKMKKRIQEFRDDEK